MNKKYAQWGKGLKQMEDHSDNLRRDLHEMNKPLARHADDADMNRDLKDQLHDGDPMLQYIKKKKTKDGKEVSGKIEF